MYQRKKCCLSIKEESIIRQQMARAPIPVVVRGEEPSRCVCLQLGVVIKLYVEAPSRVTDGQIGRKQQNVVGGGGQDKSIPKVFLPAYNLNSIDSDIDSDTLRGCPKQ
jgi:hypothetical protein